MRRYGRLLSGPNVVTLIRPCCILPYLWLCLQSRWEALVLYAVVVSSDMLDGWLARKRRQESTLGRTLDHVCDVGFILAALGYFAGAGLAPWWLPVAIAWSFGLYCLNSWWRRDRQPQLRLLGSQLGHVGGILYYVTVGVSTGLLVLAPAMLSSPIMHWWYGGVTLVALVAGLQHLLAGFGSLKLAAFAGQHRENLHQSSRSES